MIHHETRAVWVQLLTVHVLFNDPSRSRAYRVHIKARYNLRDSAREPLAIDSLQDETDRTNYCPAPKI